jgi:HK97 family phage major capsid protein
MSKEQIERLYKEAGRAHSQATEIIKEYTGKDTPAEKTAQIDALLDETETKTAEAKRLERAEQLGSGLDEPTGRLGNGGLPAGDEKGADGAAGLEQKAFTKGLRNGSWTLNETERKALRADDDAAGGYMTAPQTFATELLKFVDDLVVVRKLGTVMPLGASESLGVLSLDTDLSDWDWTTELATGSEDTVKPFGKRALKPHPLAKRIKISNTLIRRGVRPVESLVQNRLGYKLGVTLEKAYLVGTGAQQPLGMFVASNDGIPTSRDVTYTVTNDKTKVDSLIDMKFSLKQQYQDAATTRWLLHRDMLKAVRKLRDANEQFVWAPGLQGQPSTILDIPLVQSEHAPNTISSGNYLAILGDISFYWMVDSLQMQIQTLLELYAETNQRGYIGRYEGDGQPMLAEAFARLKHA